MSTGSIRTPSKLSAIYLHIQVLDVLGVRLDEVLALLDVRAHEDREQAIGRGGVLDVHPEQRARLRVHRGLPQLLRVHLAEALEPLRLELPVRVAVELAEVVPLLLREEVVLP